MKLTIMAKKNLPSAVAARLKGLSRPLLLALVACSPITLPAQIPAVTNAAPSTAASRAAYATFAMQHPGDPARGQQLFTNVQMACIRCHTIDGSSSRVGPDLSAIGDKFQRPELIRSILEPSSTIAIGYDTTVLETKWDEEYQGVIKQATEGWIELMGWDGKLFRVPTADIKTRQATLMSYMPSGLEASMTRQDFADLITFLESLHQRTIASTNVGLPDALAPATRPVMLRPFLGAATRFNHPVFFGAVPGFTNLFVVLEHAGKSWLVERTSAGDSQTTLLDLGGVVRVGGATGLLGLAFHPQFAQNRKYYLKYQILEDGRIKTLLVERRFTPDFHGDAGEPARELLRITSTTQDHNGGCIVFGPDGFLYLGMGDTGPQGDPQGHGQDLSLLLGKMLRLDVDHPAEGREYGIPPGNPFANQPGARPEIWAYGLREPWRFSFDRDTGDLWLGDVGQDRFEEISILRIGENHGWNVFEGFNPYSERRRRAGENYIPPVFSYSHRDGVSVTGGYVYRGGRNPAMRGRYICADFESRRLWAITQTNRTLASIVELGRAPSRAVSFAQDPEGELYLVGYDDGVIYHLDLADADPSPLEAKVLAETAERIPVTWSYSLEDPGTNWSQPDFDASGWLRSPGGFGTRDTPGTMVRTEWRTSNIWLRRDFNVTTNAVQAQVRSLVLRIHHDEDVEVYLNGVEVARLPRWTMGYVEVALSQEAVRALRPAHNLLAIHCRQNTGGQYIDAGLIEYFRPTK